MHSPIRVTIGWTASTARGTACSCAISTPIAHSAPAMPHDRVSRLTSPKPEKRHMPRGTPAATNTSTYVTTTASRTHGS